MGKGRSFEALLRSAGALLAEANGRDLTELTDGEIVEAAELSAQVAKLAEAAHVRAVGRLDTSRAWAHDGSRSGSAWVAWHCHVAKGRAGAVLKCARQLRDMPRVEAAMAAGRLTLDHVRLLAGAHRADPDSFVADEERLISAGERLLFSRFERVIRYWIYAHASDDAEAAAATVHDERRVDASRSIDGIVFVDAMLDPITGEIFLRELERLEQELFDADWAAARDRLGDAATAADLLRTPKQRRADALRVMAERSAAKPAGATERVRWSDYTVSADGTIVELRFFHPGCSDDFERVEVVETDRAVQITSLWHFPAPGTFCQTGCPFGVHPATVTLAEPVGSRAIQQFADAPAHCSDGLVGATNREELSSLGSWP